MNRGSNHPTQVFKHVSKGIEHRLSNNSPNKEIFEWSKQEYEEALKNDGYRINLEYRGREESNTQKRRNRPRKILWFNHPYNMEEVKNLGKEFFKLLKRNFPSGSLLHKIFNKNCVKLSYSCMPNKTSFSHEKYRHSTMLSSYVWELKDNKGIDPIMKWEVIKKCRKYRAGDRSCLLCRGEKLAIASCKSRDMLNQRSEVLNSCRHKRAWLLYN